MFPKRLIPRLLVMPESFIRLNTFGSHMRVGFLLLGNAPFYLTGYGTQLKILGDKLIEEGYPVGHVVDFGYAFGCAFGC